MDATRWTQIQAAFDELIQLDTAERLSRLAQLRDRDPELSRWVGALLAADEHAGERLDHPEPELAPNGAGGAAAASAAVHLAPDPFGLTGRTVSHFRVVEPLGIGGMGVVYRAEDLRLGRTVALKFLLPEYGLDAAAKTRFLHEARSTAVLDHPNICTIHEVGESEEGQLFLAMSCYSGETLKTRLAREGALSIDRALEIATQIARGLARAHEAGIVHRDLKPANLMITPDGTVRILDFGLAKVRDVSLTASGAVMGTIAYMSPEQILGDPVDARTDLWSLGVVLFEMLTGQHPFRGDYAAGILTQHVEVGRARTMQPELPEELTSVLERLLRKDPAERYQSANDLLADLSARQRSGAVQALPAGRLPRLPRTWRGWGGVAALVLIVSVVSVVLWRQTSSRRGASIVAGSEMPPRLLSLAVLPLKNRSGDPAQEYFADGMTEELTTTLTKIEGLRVIAHQSVLQFKHSDRSVSQIARLLDVKHLVDGSVLQDGERVRITATLIDAARNTPIWGERFERERSDILALQREVALAIARAIEIALTPQDLARLEDTTEVDPEAFDLYVRGTQARYKILNSGVEAESYFARAVAEDSSYAPAYAGLAFVHTFSGDETRAREFAEKALRLDPKLAEAHVARGMIRQTFDWDWEGAENEFRQAIRLNPGYAEAHHELSMLLQRRSQFDEALLEARRTLYLAPMSARFEQGLGEIQFYARRYDEALRAAGKVIALDSNYAAPYGLRGSAYMYLGRYDESVEAFKKCIKLGCEADENLGYIYAVTGRRAEAVRVIDSLKARWKERKGFDAVIAPHGIAVVYAGLGEREQAVDWLERAVERGDFFMLYLGIDPAFRSLHAEPRFRALLKKVGLDKNDRVAPRAPPR